MKYKEMNGCSCDCGAYCCKENGVVGRELQAKYPDGSLGPVWRVRASIAECRSYFREKVGIERGVLKREVAQRVD